jgi:hypothetical protein
VLFRESLLWQLVLACRLTRDCGLTTSYSNNQQIITALKSVILHKFCVGAGANVAQQHYKAQRLKTCNPPPFAPAP